MGRTTRTTTSTSARMKKAAKRPRNECIMVTGAADFLGGAILRILERHNPHRRLIAIDRHQPPVALSHAEFHQIDLAGPSAERLLRTLLEECGSNTTIVHTALPLEPVRQEAYAHQLMIAGTLALLRAAKTARSRKLILASTSDIYGAFPTNPNYLPEDYPLRGGSQSSYLESRIYVEEMFRKYEATNPSSVVTVLRPCTIIGSSIRSLKSTFLQQPVIPSVLGFDPLIQFIHESDVLRAFITVIERDAPGIYNVVGDGVMPLSRAIRLAKRTSVPLPEFILSFVAEMSWNFGMGLAPAKHIAFLKYPCVADGEKARVELGFVPVYTSQEALLSFAGQEPLAQGSIA